MLSVFNLVDANKEKLMPDLLQFLKDTDHLSILSGLSPAQQEAEILKIQSEEGIIMVAYNAGKPEGGIIIKKKNAIEGTLVEFVMRSGYEDRAVDVLYLQARKKMQRAGMSQLFGPSEWFQSVEDDRVSSKLLM